MHRLAISRPRWFATLGCLVALSIVLAGLAHWTAPSASAHNWNYCGDGGAIRWAGTSTSYYHNYVWAGQYLNAIDNGANQFNRSDFDFNLVPYNQPYTLAWYDYGSSDTSLAGVTSLSVNCSTHTITSGSLYINFAHFTASSHTQAQIQCTTIHEFGHAAGFDHNATTSILLQGHNQRCHSSLITTLQSHDYSDINGRY
jgi:predicted Zn-dependent protease